MTDESTKPNPNQNLAPAQPVAPRRKLPANPRMAQPVRPPAATPAPPEVVRDVVPEIVAPPAQQMALDDEEVRAETAAVVEPAEKYEPAQEAEPTKVSEPAAEAEPAAVAAPEPAAVVEPVPPAAPAPLAEDASLAAPEFDFPKTMRETLRRVDDMFATFRAAAGRFPSERMDERIGDDGWTRKQMLEHIAAWHDLTADRVIKMVNTGQSVPLDRDTDSFNAAVARQAIGKTSGEVLQHIDATFNRLRRQLSRVTDAQLRNDNWWLAFVIGGNTYGHYEEHWADIYTPELPPTSRSRR